MGPDRSSRAVGTALVIVAATAIIAVSVTVFSSWGIGEDGTRAAPVDDPASVTTLESGPDPARVADPGELPDPVAEGAELPDGYRESFPRDAIAPIYDPVHVPAGAVDWPDDALVIGVELDGDARAYPIAPLNRREMVNDEVGGHPVLITWCPLCATAMVHDRELNGDVSVFGNQGDLYGNAMTWWDHATGSVWSQPTGEALLGPLAGERLELLPSTLTEWGAWRDTHPDTLALNERAGPAGVSLDEVVVVVAHGGDDVGFGLADVDAAGGLVNDRVGGLPVAVVTGLDGVRPWHVFSRQIGDEKLTLALEGGRLVDETTGTAWNAATGQGIEGPLADEALEALPANTVFPDDFATFHPDGEIRALTGR